jgi:hypothetical protein
VFVTHAAQRSTLYNALRTGALAVPKLQKKPSANE